MAELRLIGVPTSAGAHHAGQDRTPAALRELDLVGRLAEAGVRVIDVGDVAGEVWTPDRPDATARNLEAVTRVAAAVAGAVERERRAGRVVLAVGGDCTITLGVVAGLRRTGTVALAYLDGDADLSSPDTTRSGVLDATGVAHLLGIADNSLSRLGPRFPLLAEGELALLGYDPDDAGSVDEHALEARPGLLHATFSELAADPIGLASAALASAAGEQLVVHFDVDVVDGRELPLANFPHYGTGVPVETARTVLRTLVRDDRLAAIVLTEVNPTHDPSGVLLQRYVELVVDVVGGAAVLAAGTAPA